MGPGPGFVHTPNGDTALTPPDNSTFIDFPPLEDCPLNFHAWENELLYHPDSSFILDGLRNGFKLLSESDTLCIDSYAYDNYSSATCAEFKPEMDQLFLNELALGRISRVTTKPKCIHPIGRVPKKDSGKSRPITDCSRPPGTSLNDYIKRDLESFRMNSIDTPVLVSTENCFYAIVDIESAWRWVPVFPPHRELQGFRWMLVRMTLLATSTLLIIGSVLAFRAPPLFLIVYLMLLSA